MNLSEKEQKKYLQAALNDSKNCPNVIDGKNLIIKDEKTLIKVLDPILIGIYGKNQISSEMPYECYQVGNYWYAFGSLRKGWLGGTFEVVIDGTNLQIIKLIHGK